MCVSSNQDNQAIEDGWFDEKIDGWVGVWVDG